MLTKSERQYLDHKLKYNKAIFYMLVLVLPLVILPMVMDFNISRNWLSAKNITFVSILILILIAFYNVILVTVYPKEKNLVEDFGFLRLVEGEQTNFFWNKEVLTMPKNWEVKKIKSLSDKRIKIRYYRLKIFPSIKKFHFQINCVLNLDEYSIDADIKNKQDWKDSFAHIFHIPFLILFIGFGIMSSEVKEELDALFLPEFSIEEVRNFSQQSNLIQFSEILQMKEKSFLFVRLENITFIEPDHKQYILFVNENDLFELRNDYQELIDRKKEIKALFDKSKEELIKIKVGDGYSLKSNPYLNEFLSELSKIDTQSRKAFLHLYLLNFQIQDVSDHISESYKEELRVTKNKFEVFSKKFGLFAEYEIGYFQERLGKSYTRIANKEKIQCMFFITQEIWTVPKILRENIFQFEEESNTIWKNFYKSILKKQPAIDVFVFKKEGTIHVTPRDFALKELQEYIYLKSEYNVFFYTSMFFLALEIILIFQFFMRRHL